MKLFSLAAHLTALSVLAALTFRLWRNLRFLRHVRETAGPPSAQPSVSVLVPARNEARSVTACIESLAEQNYPHFEVIALDDQSTDGTGALLDDLAARYAHVRVHHADKNPPAGWNGKSYACARLSEQAAGEWLLFTDADTLHTPESIAQGIAQAQHLGADLLSAFPRQITGSWSERVFVSFIVDFLPLLTVDLHALWRGGSGRTVANGQYLLVRASAYRAVGGHQAIAAALVDDFALAAHMRANGCTVAFVDGTRLLSCRMYHSAREVWQGFSKNILLALETSSTERHPAWLALLFAWGYACLFVLPFWLFAAQPLFLLEIGWLYALRLIVNRHLSRPVSEIAATPLAGWGVMLFALNALLHRKRHGQIVWKGRSYPSVG